MANSLLNTEIFLYMANSLIDVKVFLETVCLLRLIWLYIFCLNNTKLYHKLLVIITGSFPAKHVAACCGAFENAQKTHWLHFQLMHISKNAVQNRTCECTLSEQPFRLERLLLEIEIPPRFHSRRLPVAFSAAYAAFTLATRRRQNAVDRPSGQGTLDGGWTDPPLK